ncbi:MAG: FG-GAP repeat protein [Deltaproteobacteria bacterium]|nr:FG-GAP repeat protein [Deltaproteobacteria bacterium]
MQLTSECATATYEACPFAMPELDVEVRDTRFVPEVPLDVETLVRPLGRRYFWRVAACSAAGCSDFSVVRYLDVGRLRDDFDGDGYSDALVGAPNQDVGAVPEAGVVYVFAGSRSGISPDRWVALRNPVTDASLATTARFGHNVASLGDVDGDGFADAIVGAPLLDSLDVLGGTMLDVGAAYLYRGSSDGLVDAPIPIVNPSVMPATAWFGSSVAGPGDLDGDGYADVVVAAHREDDEIESEVGRVYLYPGRAGGIDGTAPQTIPSPLSARLERFGRILAGHGDFDGDGYVELVSGSPNANTHRGRAYVFRGGRGPLRVDPEVTLETTATADGYFGFALGTTGDIDGDGRADLVVGALRDEFPTMLDDVGNLHVYLGGPSGLRPETEVRVPSPTPVVDGFFGFAVGATELDGDPLADVLVGATGQGALTEGEVLYFRSTGTISTTPTATIAHPFGGHARAGFGAGLVVHSDFDGDGHVDVVVGAPRQRRTVDGVGAVFVLTDPTGSFDPPDALRIDHPEAQGGALFGYALDGTGGSDPGN